MDFEKFKLKSTALWEMTTRKIRRNPNEALVIFILSLFVVGCVL